MRSPLRFVVVAPVLPVLFVLACPAPSAGGGGTSRPTADVKGDPIAVVGKATLTVEELQKRIDEQSPFVRVRYTDPAKKKEFLDSQVRFEVLAEEAFARGLDKDPEILEATKKIIVQKLTRDEFDGKVKLQDVSDADLQAYFDAHQADYQKAETVRASHIAVAFGTDKAAAKKKADEVQKKAAAPATLKDRNVFKELAAATSTDEATKRAGGDLRYLTAEDAEQKLGPAARAWLFGATKESGLDEVSPVIEGKEAFHVFKRTGYRAEVKRTFDQVKTQIKNVVFREKRVAAFDAFVDELKKKHGVTLHEEKLDRVKVNAQLPPSAEGGHGHDHGGHAPSAADADEGAPPLGDAAATAPAEEP